jgi:hypothetical protein
VPGFEIGATLLEDEPHAAPDVAPLRFFQAAVDQATDSEHGLPGEKAPLSGFVAEPPFHTFRVGVRNSFQQLIQGGVSAA